MDMPRFINTAAGAPSRVTLAARRVGSMFAGTSTATPPAGHDYKGPTRYPSQRPSSDALLVIMTLLLF
jgi:hypothetical protein